MARRSIQDMDLSCMFHIQRVFEIIVHSIDHHVDVLLLILRNELVVIDDQYHRLYYTEKFKEKSLVCTRELKFFLLHRIV